MSQNWARWDKFGKDQRFLLDFKAGIVAEKVLGKSIDDALNDPGLMVCATLLWAGLQRIDGNVAFDSVVDDLQKAIRAKKVTRKEVTMFCGENAKLNGLFSGFETAEADLGEGDEKEGGPVPATPLHVSETSA